VRATTSLAGRMWAMLAEAIIVLLVVKPLMVQIAVRFAFLARSFGRLGHALR